MFLLDVLAGWLGLTSWKFMELPLQTKGRRYTPEFSARIPNMMGFKRYLLLNMAIGYLCYIFRVLAAMITKHLVLQLKF